MIIVTKKILLCCSLDHAILSNHAVLETSKSIQLLHRLARRPEIILVYASGISLALMRQAIQQFNIPVPDYAMSDVATTLYQVKDREWRLIPQWVDEFEKDWSGRSRLELATLLADYQQIRLQEPEKQNNYKLSYYAHPHIDYHTLINETILRFTTYNIQVSVMWSIDRTLDLGLLDILPASATRRHALDYLMKLTNIVEERVVYAGDSGNDLPVLTSGLQVILGRNTEPELCAEVERRLGLIGALDKRYVAEGCLFEMNGNDCAGMIEGAVHFLPEVLDWLE